MYLIFSVVFGLVGAVFSVLVRMEMAVPGIQVMQQLFFLGEPNQVFNVLITGHGLIMVFFMVMPALIGGFGNWFVYSPLISRFTISS